MPRYEYACECDGERKIFILRLPLSEYKPEVPCPCGKGTAKRVFNTVAVREGLTANEKRIGTTPKRKEMAEFMKDQRTARKKAYGSDTREGQSNELWTGNEGRDGVTQLPVSPTPKQVP